jgi:hypothetical protein
MYEIDLTNIFDDNQLNDNIIYNSNIYNSDIYINENLYDIILNIDNKIDEIKNLINKNKTLFIITIIYIFFYLFLLILPLFKYIKINKFSLLISLTKFVLLTSIF